MEQATERCEMKDGTPAPNPESEQPAVLSMLAERLRDKYTFAKPCCVDDDTPDAHTVWLKIGNQSFCIDGYQDTKEEADWMRLMLGKALLALLSDTNCLSAND